MDMPITALTHAVLDELRAAQLAPCCSLYQPTHRRFPENRQDPIRFRNLLRALGASLRAAPLEGAAVAALLAPLEALAGDEVFWAHTAEGLAVFASPALHRVVLLQRPVPERAIVADSFHLKPLRRQLWTLDRFQVLALRRDEIALFEGTRDGLVELPLAPGVPRTLTDALGTELTEPHTTVASYGGEPGIGMHHGHGGRKDEVDVDTERFFRAVDRAVWEHHSRPTGLPLLLASLPEHQGRFRGLSHNPLLLPAGIDVDPAAVRPEELAARAWQVMEPRFAEQLGALRDEIATARAHGLASAELAEVATAAATGRVATLLVEAEGVVPGRVDETSGRIRPGSLEDPEVDDLLDDLGELVEQRGGRVLVLPADAMPVDGAVAALYRY